MTSGLCSRTLFLSILLASAACKSFQLLEKIRLQFRFEAFTFTNTPRFGAPGNVLGTANFGAITGAATARNLQFGMKLIW
ncbi:MAG: hypothetical protein SGI92_10335 [Bryobacteraceae bacterium]|nr:hypothetical protein [Bryobacteraceae bacterium]